jgi:hypothetical protein
MIGQMVSLVGAAMILLAFAGQQSGRLKSEDRAYLLLNLVGAAILTYFAVKAENLGLTVLEGSWTLISLWSVVKSLRASPQRG